MPQMCPDLCIILIAIDDFSDFYFLFICHRLYLEYAPFFFFFFKGAVHNEGFFIKALKHAFDEACAFR